MKCLPLILVSNLSFKVLDPDRAVVNCVSMAISFRADQNKRQISFNTGPFIRNIFCLPSVNSSIDSSCTVAWLGFHLSKTVLLPYSQSRYCNLRTYLNLHFYCPHSSVRFCYHAVHFSCPSDVSPTLCRTHIVCLKGK